MTFTKIRANNNKLPVVTERYENISREERLCTKCTNNVVRDEFYIMMLRPNENFLTNISYFLRAIYKMFR